MRRSEGDLVEHPSREGRKNKYMSKMVEIVSRCTVHPRDRYIQGWKDESKVLYVDKQ